MILVAGAGAGGLVSALSAASQGAEVLLLEVDSRSYLACNSARSTGMVMAGGTLLQRQSGIEDDWEQLFNDIMRKNGGDCPVEVARALAKTSAPMVDWLAEGHGIPLQVITDFRYPGHSNYHMHATPGRTGRELIAALWDAVRRDSRITVAEGMKLSRIQSTFEGMIDRVEIQGPQGDREWLSVDALILATNGFAANRPWVEQYIPEMAEALYFGGTHSDGSGIEAAMAIGASVDYMDAYQGHATVNAETGMLVSYSVIMTGGILVNKRGSRFANETRGYSELASVVLQQPEGLAFAVFDHQSYQIAREFDDFRAVDHLGGVQRWSSLETLGLSLGFDPGGWTQEIKIIQDCQNGRAEDPWGRRLWGNPWRAPYFSVRVRGALLHTQGGLRVSPQAEVLGVSGNPLPGLYACGGAAAGISGHGAAGYLSGNGLLSAMGLGYIAGHEAATWATTRKGDKN